MPVETQFGFHIIQLVERLGNTFNTNHILITPSSSSTDIEDARKYLDSLRTVIVNDSITFEKAAKEYSDDKATSGSGGFFLDATGASRVSVEELDPVIFFTIDTMQVNTITKPMDFRMEDGTEAVRILYFKEKIAPHQANLLEDYQKIRSATLASKRNIKLSNWFKEAKGDVYIHLEPEYEYCEILKD
jgi:peptidyl-prolyl cis-trans isomerase SurA